MRIALTLALLLAIAAPAQAARVTAISNAYDHACALRADGTIKCWGANEHGQLGDGTRKRRLTAVGVRGIADAKAISVTVQDTCALLADGTIKCWGANRYGQLGDGTKTTRVLPVAVAGIAGATQVVTDYAATCALLADRTVRCWGDNAYGDLGDGTRTASLTPVPVSGLTDVVALSYRDANGCALLAGATMSCWGWDGSLGEDHSGDRLTPAPVAGATGLVAIDTGAYYTCGLKQGGVPVCASTGKPLKRVKGYGRLSAYDFTYDGQQTTHDCGLYANGTIKCSSPNPMFGQLGNGRLTDKPSGPVRVRGIDDATAISATDTYTCAVLAGGSVKCWGGNANGTLGDGTTKTRPAPVRVRGL